MVWFGPASLGPAGGAGGLVCRRQVGLLRPAQVGTCGVVPRPVPGGGIRAFSESPDASRGGMPPPPEVRAARSHSLVLAWWSALSRSIGYYEPHVRALIWRLSFVKCFLSIFFPENASQIGLSIPETTPLSYQRQRSQKAGEREQTINPGSRGAAPALFLPISREKWGPPPGRRGPGALRPKGASEAPTQRVRLGPRPHLAVPPAL